MTLIRGLSPEEGAVVSTVIERRPECGARLTTVVVRSSAPFGAEEAAQTWWERIMSRLEEGLPHQRTLVEKVSGICLLYTTPEIPNLLRRRNGRGKPQPEVTQKQKRGASDIFFSDAKATGRLFPPAEEPGETR